MRPALKPKPTLKLIALLKVVRGRKEEEVHHPQESKARAQKEPQEGGKRKRKKKKYTTPKKVKHVHKKSPKKVLEYYQVDESGKIKRLKMESPHAPVGTYMADHPDRYVCGKTGFTLWRTNDKGERLAIPKQTHKSGAEKEKAVVVKAVKKKGK